MGNRSKKVELTMKEQMLASISGAGITALTMTPFDVVKGKYIIYKIGITRPFGLRS